MYNLQQLAGALALLERLDFKPFRKKKKKHKNDEAERILVLPVCTYVFWFL